ncbi:alcohol dehydrogenase transcription factor myb/sant-like [Holotrichia oblita]|uniref:Alcohol dehydrogenase transcription factor myb/sant-like n=1 Tax=Holotrichia oblita TaxID=644536 RepID=A0ACB9SHT9_HOLOL|nr:alcohol dehydrogenase transcription factor myb/sant-like [Holotrichia oblita]
MDRAEEIEVCVELEAALPTTLDGLHRLVFLEDGPPPLDIPPAWIMIGLIPAVTDSENFSTDTNSDSDEGIQPRKNIINTSQKSKYYKVNVQDTKTQAKWDTIINTLMSESAPKYLDLTDENELNKLVDNQSQEIEKVNDVTDSDKINAQLENIEILIENPGEVVNASNNINEQTDISIIGTNNSANVETDVTYERSMLQTILNEIVNIKCDMKRIYDILQNTQIGSVGGQTLLQNSKFLDYIPFKSMEDINEVESLLVDNNNKSDMVCKEIQGKWKNLKDCFARELSTQRKVKSGEPARKRRKYIYFDSLLFLLPFMKARATSGNMAPAETNNDNNQEDQDPAIPCTTLSNNNNEDQTNIPNRRPKKATQNITSYESTLLKILQQKQNEEISEDKQLALMLVPMLQNLNDD